MRKRITSTKVEDKILKSHPLPISSSFNLFVIIINNNNNNNHHLPRYGCILISIHQLTSIIEIVGSNEIIATVTTTRATTTTTGNNLERATKIWAGDEDLGGRQSFGYLTLEKETRSVE